MRITHGIVLAGFLVSACGMSPAGAPAGEPRSVEFPEANRPDVMGTSGAVSSDHPLASAAGYEILRRGGNAVDAVVTMAAVLAVVRPHMSGVGGDALGLFYDPRTGKVTALDASGRAGSRASREHLLEKGLTGVPETGAYSVTVPGAVSGWQAALDAYGTITLAEALAPAIAYAEDGFPVSARLRADILEAAPRLDEGGRAIYLPDGNPPAVGERLRNPALAKTLRTLAAEGPDAFYQGEIGERIVAFLKERDGFLEMGDLRTHTPSWKEPISIEYLGYRIHALPPSTQGLAQLQQMRLAERFDLVAMGHNSADYLHTLVEVKRLAFADRDRWIADPDFFEVPVGRLLDAEYAAERAALIRGDQALGDVEPGLTSGSAVRTRAESSEDDGDTVYITAVDADGNAVSWIQSLFRSFGSGLVDPVTGIVLHNRGAGFRLDPEHPSALEPGKRPFHTLAPLLAVGNDGTVLTLGTPGGDGQTQTLIQVFHNLALFGMRPQVAVEAARFRSDPDRLLLEDRIPAEVIADLVARGHGIRVVAGWDRNLGGAQLIIRDRRTGVVTAAADPRREAYAIAY